jgi:hypothetical protein
MIEVGAAPKVVTMEGVAALDVSGAAPLGHDAAVTGALDLDPAASCQPVVDVHPSADIVDIGHPAVGAGAEGVAAPGDVLIASARRRATVKCRMVEAAAVRAVSAWIAAKVLTVRGSAVRAEGG